VLYPLINPNEPEAMLAAIHVSEGQRVTAGDRLLTLETTKSTAEVTAEAGGFVAGIQAAQGQTVNAGEIFCYLAETPDWAPPVEALGVEPELGLPKAIPPLRGPGPRAASSTANIPDGLRITQPALALAQQQGLDLSKLPAGRW